MVLTIPLAFQTDLIRLSNERDGQTDGQTDRDTQALYSIRLGSKRIGIDFIALGC